jgi:mRNA interferase HicA
VKRQDLIRYFRRHGCELLREGGSHSVFVNRAALKTSTVPRHREVNEFLARKICRDLQVPEP